MKKKYFLLISIALILLLTACNRSKSRLKVYYTEDLVIGNLVYHQPILRINAKLPIITNQKVSQINYITLHGTNIEEATVKITANYDDINYSYQHLDFYILETYVLIEQLDFTGTAEIEAIELEIISEKDKKVEKIPFRFHYQYDPELDYFISYANSFMRSAGGPSFQLPNYEFTLYPFHDITLISFEDYSIEGIQMVSIGRSDKPSFDFKDVAEYTDAQNIHLLLEKDYYYQLNLFFNYTKGKSVAYYFSIVFTIQLEDGQIRKVYYNKVPSPFFYKDAVIEYIEENFLW